MIDGLAEGGELRNVEDAITIGTTLRHCWFRGAIRPGLLSRQSTDSVSSGSGIPQTG